MADRKQLFSKRFILPLLVLFAFVIRMISLSRISSNGNMYFTGTDAFYHMRRVFYTTENFPSVLTFDSYLNYPLGYDIGWPPLYDHAIALLALVLGMGSPDTGTIEFAGAVFPALIGALTLVPLYVASSAIFDKRTALVSAAVFSLIPVHLAVSIAGATDHHVAEVFLAASAYAFYLLSLKSGRDADLSFSDIRTGKLNQAARRSVLYSILSGFMLVLAVFTWMGSPVFIGLIGVFVFVQLTADIKLHRSSEYILISTIIVFLTTLVLVIPLIAMVVRPGLEFSGMFLSWFHVAYIASLLVGTVILGLIAGSVVSKKLSWYYYPAVILVLSGIGIMVLRTLSPEFYQNTIGGIQYLLVSSSTVLGTVAEAQPLFYNRGFTIRPLWNSFFIFSILAIIGILFSGLKLTREKYMPEMVFFFVWSVIIIVLTISQRRFSYLLALNVAMLSGFFLSVSYTYLVNGTVHTSNKRVSGKKSRSKKAASIDSKPSSAERRSALKALAGDSSATRFLLMVLTAIIVLVMSAQVLGLVTNPGIPSTDWRESLEWLESNTPETSYFSDPSLEPEYGVMSWWDYGNWILYIAKRPVVANNFQTGVEDSAHFFATLNESESLSILDRNNAKYVVTDHLMYATKSGAIFEIAGEDYMMGQDFATFYNSRDMRNTTLVKLHILDGSYIGRLRLIHESPNSEIKIIFGGNEEEGVPIKNVKIFEYVAGARIYGSAEPDQEVHVTVGITSNQGRQFTYENMAAADSSGLYELRVPYHTGGSNAGITADPYYVVYQESTGIRQEVGVSEEDVLQGNEIRVDLM